MAGVVHGEGLGGEHRRVAVRDPGDEQPQADPAGDTGQGGERRHPLEAVARTLAVHGFEVVESPRAVVAEVLGEPHAVDELVELHALLGHVDAESHASDPSGAERPPPRASAARTGVAPRRRGSGLGILRRRREVAGIGHGELVSHHGGAPRLRTLGRRWSSAPLRMAAASSASSPTPRARRRSAWARARAGPRAISRPTMRTTLAATRAWKRRRPSVPAMTSVSRNSPTASSSSAADGMSCGGHPRRDSGSGAPGVGGVGKPLPALTATAPRGPTPLRTPGGPRRRAPPTAAPPTCG